MVIVVIRALVRKIPKLGGDQIIFLMLPSRSDFSDSYPNKLEARLLLTHFNDSPGSVCVKTTYKICNRILRVTKIKIVKIRGMKNNYIMSHL